MIPMTPALRFDGAAPARVPRTTRATASTASGRGRRLCCRACGHVVTDAGARREVQGSHEYTRTNPAGVRYRFGCFRAAPGCRAVGAASAEFSWFSGCLWRVAACGNCAEHLGWRFSGAEGFWGLILERLVEQRAQ